MSNKRKSREYRCDCGCGQTFGGEPKLCRMEQTRLDVEKEFACLSAEAKYRIMDFVRFAMDEAYPRGFHAGYEKATQQAAEDAAGEAL